MDTLITLPEATNLTQLSEQVLKNLVASGKIKASMLTNGALVIKQNDVQAYIPRDTLPDYQQFKNLSGQGIGIREASRKFGIPDRTISRWVQKGYIRILQHAGRKIIIDLADVSYCDFIYKQNPGQGKWLFSQNGAPYSKS